MSSRMYLTDIELLISFRRSCHGQKDADLSCVPHAHCAAAVRLRRAGLLGHTGSKRPLGLPWYGWWITPKGRAMLKTLPGLMQAEIRKERG